jgi:hypothetical protein
VLTEMYASEIAAYLIFGIMLNFAFSMLFGYFLSKNIGIEEMMQTKGDKPQSPLVAMALFIPYLKMLITLYRVVILQIYFLNRGKTYREFWIYLTTED